MGTNHLFIALIVILRGCSSWLCLNYLELEIIITTIIIIIIVANKSVLPILSSVFNIEVGLWMNQSPQGILIFLFFFFLCCSCKQIGMFVHCPFVNLIHKVHPVRHLFAHQSHFQTISHSILRQPWMLL